MLFPKKTKYIKSFKLKGHFSNIDYSQKATKLQFGVCGLQILENGRITPKHIDAVRKSFMKNSNKIGFLWIGVFPDTPVTKKPQEVRMGKGKGGFNYWCFKIKKGRMLFEAYGGDPLILKSALKRAAVRLPMKTRLISNF